MKSKQERDQQQENLKRKQQEVAKYFQKFKDQKRFHEVKEAEDKTK